MNKKTKKKRDQIEENQNCWEFFYHNKSTKDQITQNTSTENQSEDTRIAGKKV